MIEELISECTDYDFKDMLEEKKPKSWLKTVSAFANGIGGKIFFGVSDDKTITGVKDTQKMIEKITGLIDKHITPRIVYKITPYSENDKTILELSINPGVSTPYYFHNEGTKTAFVRVGSSTIEAPDYILNELILKGTGKTYDGVVTGFEKSDFAFSILKSDFFERTGTAFTDQDFVFFGLATKDGFLTNGGILLADSNPYRHSRVFCTKWNGKDKTNEEEASDDEEIGGSLIRQLKMAMDFYRSNTKKKWHKEKGETIYEPDYSDDAIMETLVNALIHRNYNNLGAEVCLNIYDDRIEITSPGIMVSGDPVPKHVDYPFESMRRNPNIADVFWKMGYMNRRGSGLAKITDSTNALFKDGNNHVMFQIRNSFFVVTIDNANYRPDLYHALNERQKAIINALMKTQKNISLLAKEINADRKTIRNDLLLLEEMGLVTATGTTRSKVWKLK